MIDELRFDGRVAIVTGAGRAGGMGAAHARTLARRGAKIVVNDIVDDGESGSRRVADEINESGGSAVANRSDVSAPAGGAEIVADALEHFGRIDIVINNAGALPEADFPDVEGFDVFAQTFAVHLGGAFNVTRAAWRHLASAGYGRIVNITSSALLGNPADMGYALGGAGNVGVSYPTMKAGMIGLTKTLANIGAAHGIKVNAVAPAAATRMAPRNTSILPSGAEVPLDPALVSAGIVVLVHERCPASGEILGMGGGKVDRLFVGATQGYVDPELAPESVLANWDRVMDPQGFWIPADTKAHADRLRQDRVVRWSRAAEGEPG